MAHLRSGNCTFYCCYLLQSVPKPGSFYIGSTPDPYRRIRQHNGQLTQGATRTKSAAKRPWRMACIISGFQSRISALQFEHAWQHSFQTRHIPDGDRITTNKTSARGLDKHLGNLRLLSRAPAFKTTPLAVHLFEAKAEQAWDLNKYRIPTEIEVIRDARVEESELIGGGASLKHLLQKRSTKVEILAESRDIIDSHEGLVGVCPHCRRVSSLTLLAAEMLKQNGDKGLIPAKKNKCPNCLTEVAWHEVASTAINLRNLASQTPSVTSEASDGYNTDSDS